MVMDLLEEPKNLMESGGVKPGKPIAETKSLKLKEDLGGGNSQFFFMFIPKILGKVSIFDFVIFFKGVGEKTTNQRLLLLSYILFWGVAKNQCLRNLLKFHKNSLRFLKE